jgi:uncharacterized membrane protein YkoI
MLKRIFLSISLLAGAALAPLPAHAQGAQTLDRILPEIRRSYPGTFSDAEPVAGPDGQVARYRIKWITPDGRIIFIEADARTGRVLGQSGGEQPNNQPRGGRRGN